eukprot:GFUD01089950.1.p1 GENE.GFUD01089950.1~~GFUD01089950.1.p1  ORF type:complete len:187 (+),score=51.96 GFUD01089950.1:52-612(+)
MKNQSLISSVYATLVFSACFLQGYSLPQQSLQRYSSEEYGRKFGSAPIDEISNDIDDKMDTSPSAKEDGGLLTTVLELAMKFMPMVISALSGETGPSQTDRIEGIDLNGEDPFSMRNVMYIGLKLFLAIVGSGSATEKSDNPMEVFQPVMGAVIGAMTGSDDKSEVAVMAKQATEVINLLFRLSTS